MGDTWETGRFGHVQRDEIMSGKFGEGSRTDGQEERLPSRGSAYSSDQCQP